jgi:MFS family permease
MRYLKKIPSTDKELSTKLISEGWTKLKEPSNLGIAILLSIPFMFINGVISIAISFYLYPPLKQLFNSGHDFGVTVTVNLFTLIYVVIIFMFMTIHEFLHACFIPNVFKSDKVYWGINSFCGFVYTTEKIKKSRFLIISIMPFILLSVILPFIINFLGWLNWFTIFLCLLNAMGSCVDCLNMCIVAIQVPKSSYIVNNGFETYFK